MFAKNVLLGSLSFATVLVVGNWSGAIAQSLNNQQKASLKSLGIEIAVPRYIPRGFRVSDVMIRPCRVNAKRNANGACRFDPSYTIVYRDFDNNCFAVGGIGGGIGGPMGKYFRKINTKILGEVEMGIGIFTPPQPPQPISEAMDKLPQINIWTWPTPATIEGVAGKEGPFYQVATIEGVARREGKDIFCSSRAYMTPNELTKIIQSLSWLQDTTTPSVPPSSTPVRPTDTPKPNKYVQGAVAEAIALQQSDNPVKTTDTIAKYPSPDDFNAFEDKLQGNPESLVKLRGNQAEQRRKFQNDWKDRNPNAAKFLGAWYSGNKYFYVFPSTAKSRTCVVTQDANGKLDMQVGSALNQELRYGGGKGFFWRDRPNIIAARDSGSGSLYPIYATFGMPELSDGMITDMDRQNCITTLPFEADAQYYKERGDKFRELGKKDEAISNYRKALELFRKQNLFAQIKTIESLIASLSDKPTTKPITKKPVDAIYSGISPLYEDVNEPNYKPDKGVTPTFRVGLNAFDVVDNGQTVKLNSQVKSNVPTIIIIHGLDTDPTDPSKAEFRNLLKAVRYNTSTQVLVVDWGQGAKPNLATAAARIEATAGKVAELIKKYNLNPSEISLIGHSLGAHVSVDVALALQSQGSVKSITLLDPAVDMPTGYTVKNLSSISESTFIRAFYTSFAGSSSFAASANESYNIKFPSQTVRLPAYTAHGEAMTLLANSFQGDSSGKRNCIAEQFTKLDRQFPSISQNIKRERPADGTKPAIDLYVDYDSNKWLYPKQIISGGLDVNPEKGNCKLESDAVRTFDSIQNILK